MGVILAKTKFTLVDSPEKMRSQNTGYSVLIPKIKNRWPHSKQKNTKKLPDTPIKSKE